MSISTFPSIVTDQLVSHYDTGNTKKSWIGAGTTNYLYSYNPRKDATYNSWSATAAGLWNANHPDAIQVFNDAGGDISWFVNTGVGTWENASHAVWTYDAILQKPVVTMRNRDSAWSAKYMSVAMNFASLGMSVGQKYTISWLQWTDDITRSADTGLYSQNASGTWNFWDGRATGWSTVLNTKVRTWERVYATFTITSNWNLSSSVINVYMYGQGGGTGILRIADTQLELLPYPTAFCQTATRSATLMDTARNLNLDISTMSYSPSGTLIHAASGANQDNIILGSGTTFAPIPYMSLEAWFRTPGESGTGNSTNGLFSLTYGCRIHVTSGQALLITNYPSTAAGNATITYSNRTNLADNKWHHIVCTCDGSNGRIYLDGVLDKQVTQLWDGGFFYAGSEALIGQDINNVSCNFTGEVPIFRIYKKTLSLAEVQQNFNAQRGRFGL
jgi:hypothetical protein